MPLKTGIPVLQGGEDVNALQFLAHPMRGVAERAIHRKAIQDREFARALAEFAVDVDEDNIKAARNE